ncbi:hypothetical protein [Cognatishimia activa]|uniref:hypothetical protein n=1 Tax=Cognatishimia activa TaxID=1715691 RepID=UPI002230ED86|nr:hypothetical protein [Cognatishimia activa]UZD91882.1 hypothetical protein M0D42_04495 [Cognatishimia activa]
MGFQIPIAVLVSLLSASIGFAKTPREAMQSLCPTEVHDLESKFNGAENYASVDDNPAVQNFWSQNFAIDVENDSPIVDPVSQGITAVGVIANFGIVSAARKLDEVSREDHQNADILEVQIAMLDCVSSKSKELPLSANVVLQALEFCGYRETLAEFETVFRSGNSQGLNWRQILDENLKDDDRCQAARKAI